MTRPALTIKRLKELLTYDPLTGDFYWRVTNNVRAAGDLAGSLKTEGYWRIGINGKQHYAHRLAWAYITGKWPKDKIDHWDRNKANNKFANLREATDAQNLQNSNHKGGASGYRGVTRSKNKWQAQITHQQKLHYLGLFDDPAEAHAAYVAAKARLHTFHPTI